MTSEEPLLSCCRISGNVQALSQLLSSPKAAFRDSFILFGIRSQVVPWVFLTDFRADAEDVDTAQCVSVKVWFVRVHVTIKAWVDCPFDNPESGAESGRNTVADGMFEVVAKNE